MHIKSKFRRIKEAFRNLKWQARTELKLWILENIYKDTPIYVTEWSDFNCEHKPGYLDVNIKFPRFFKWEFEWVFTVNCLSIYLSERDPDLVRAELWLHNAKKTPNKNALFGEDIKDTIGILEIDHRDIYRFVETNKDKVLSNPLIEYEEIFTNQEWFEQDDVVKYTRLWLKEFYPNLATRAIIFQEQ